MEALASLDQVAYIRFGSVTAIFVKPRISENSSARSRRMTIKVAAALIEGRNLDLCGTRP